MDFRFEIMTEVSINKQAKLSEHFTLGELCKTSAKTQDGNIPSHVHIENLKRLCGWLEMLRDECVRSYRLIGRGALRDHPEYDPLRRLPGAYMVGDSLVVDPAAPRFVRKNGKRRWY